MVQLAVALLFAGQVERLHVSWVAPEGCPSRSELSSQLEATVPANRTFQASVRIYEPRDEGQPWRAVVVTTADGAEHTRVVDGGDCTHVSDAAVLVVTLAATALPPAEPAPRVNPAPPIAQPPPVAEDTEAGGGEPLSRRISLGIRIQPVVAANVGLLPLPGISVGGALTLSTWRLKTQLELVGWLTSESPGASRGVRVNLVSAKLQECVIFKPHDAVRVGPCGALEIGRMSVEGTRVPRSEQVGVWWSALLAGATAGFPLRKNITPWVSGELGLNLVRPRFTVEGTGGSSTVVYGVGWVMGRLTFGVEIDLEIF